LLPEEKRNSVMLKLEQGITDNLEAGVDILYSSAASVLNIPMGSVTATVYGPGSANVSQINPFFVAPAGSTATAETVRFDAQDLLGTSSQTPLARIRSMPLATSISHREQLARHREHADRHRQELLEHHRRAVRELRTAGTERNGQSDGFYHGPTVPGTGISVSNLPLTPGNALDPFHPAATNLTSPAVRAQLIAAGTSQEANQGIEQFGLKTDGTLFAMPSGDVKLAGGVEYTT